MAELSSSSSVAVPGRSVLKALLWAWLSAGTLDISAALIYHAHASRVRAIRLLQGIASGVLGDKAFVSGPETAILGLGLHYSIALIWTLVFFLFVQRLKKPLPNLFVIGMVYGVVVWMVMNLIVVPLSNVHHAPLQLSQSIVGAVILMFCIGLPISMIVGRPHGG
jgi:hypothetical protein